jgi:isopenicillin-N N-acyltransferase-like protein
VTLLPILTVGGTPEEIGAAHGERFGPDIRQYLDARAALATEGTELGRAGIVDLARRMLPAHRDYAPESAREMEAMAEAAGISPAEAIIVGGYTDFIDAVRSLAHGRAIEDTCTAVLTPDATSDGAGFLAQTWDMHATATPHVFVLEVSPEGAPSALVFTTHGTVGQIGINEAGIAIGINNLTMADGRIGVTWPFVVRKALRQSTFDAALDAILSAPLAGGHNFLLMDEHGNGVSVEASASAAHITHLDDTPLVHTNHCLAPDLVAVEDERPMTLMENSRLRLTDATEALAGGGPHTADGLMDLFRDEHSICRHPVAPWNYETSGAVVMRPETREMWACWGLPSQNEFEYFAIGAR